jgi:hypothetical protein
MPRRKRRTPAQQSRQSERVSYNTVAIDNTAKRLLCQTSVAHLQSHADRFKARHEAVQPGLAKRLVLFAELEERATNGKLNDSRNEAEIMMLSATNVDGKQLPGKAFTRAPSRAQLSSPPTPWCAGRAPRAARSGTRNACMHLVTSHGGDGSALTTWYCTRTTECKPETSRTRSNKSSVLAFCR